MCIWGALKLTHTRIRLTDNVAPSLYARQQAIKRSHISQKLTKFLSSRPTEQQLVMQHVLPGTHSNRGVRGDEVDGWMRQCAGIIGRSSSRNAIVDEYPNESFIFSSLPVTVAELTPESPGMDVTRTTLQRLLEQRPVREQLVQRHILPGTRSVDRSADGWMER